LNGKAGPKTKAGTKARKRRAFDSDEDDDDDDEEESDDVENDEEEDDDDDEDYKTRKGGIKRAGNGSNGSNGGNVKTSWEVDMSDDDDGDDGDDDDDVDHYSAHAPPPRGSFFGGTGGLSRAPHGPSAGHTGGSGHGHGRGEVDDRMDDDDDDDGVDRDDDDDGGYEGAAARGQRRSGEESCAFLYESVEDEDEDEGEDDAADDDAADGGLTDADSDEMAAGVPASALQPGMFVIYDARHECSPGPFTFAEVIAVRDQTVHRSLPCRLVTTTPASILFLILAIPLPNVPVGPRVPSTAAGEERGGGGDRCDVPERRAQALRARPPRPCGSRPSGPGALPRRRLPCQAPPRPRSLTLPHLAPSLSPQVRFHDAPSRRMFQRPPVPPRNIPSTTDLRLDPAWVDRVRAFLSRRLEGQGEG